MGIGIEIKLIVRNVIEIQFTSLRILNIPIWNKNKNYNTWKLEISKGWLGVKITKINWEL